MPAKKTTTNLIPPLYCTGCGATIRHIQPIGKRALQAAAAVMDGAQTSRDVAKMIGTTTEYAGGYLRCARVAGIVAIKARRKRGADGGMLIEYVPTQRIAAWFPAQWKQWEKDHTRKAA